MFMGLLGTMESLTVDENHKPNCIGIPIDIIMANINNFDKISDDCDDDDEVYFNIYNEKKLALFLTNCRVL